MNSVLILLVILGIILLVVPFLMLLRQYHKHKAPLKAIDPNVRYGLWHHVQIVTLPMMRYRLAAKFKSKKVTAPVTPMVEPSSTDHQ